MKSLLPNIKDLSVNDRPREKLARLGASALSNIELMAIIIGSGSKRLPLLAISHSLVDLLDDDMANLDSATEAQLSQIKGIGQTRSVTILAAVELGRRSQRVKPLSLINDRSVVQLILPYLRTERVVQYHLVMLNARSELLATSELSVNGSQLPDLKAMIKLAVEADAHELILCRNEMDLPVGALRSESEFMKQLVAAAGMLGMKMRGLMVVANYSSRISNQDQGARFL